MRLLAPDLSQDTAKEIEAAIRAPADKPIELQGLVTTDLPSAPSYPYSFLFDTTLGQPKFSDGADWLTFSLSTHTHAASAITNTPAGNIAATNVQSALNELDSEKAALAGATFTGAVKSSSATDGVGYTTGAGGTVTQATSKSTGVTLNKVTGTIVMNNASLAAGATISFVLSNSAIGADDMVLIQLDGGYVATGEYDGGVGNVISGAAAIWITNKTGGALTDAVRIRFAILKSTEA